ncbi:MAG: RsmB/NOP family class I SAM-dependent RNA methyltransferase [Pseudomonadota bacterium]
MAREERPRVTPARKLALGLLAGVLMDGQTLQVLTAAKPFTLATPPDRARAQRLATDVLRQLERLDRLLKRHIDRLPQLPVLNALRLGAYELVVAGEAPHGVVSDLVTAVGPRKKGLVNAVLRKLSTEEQHWGKLPVPRMGRGLRKRLVAIYGNREVQLMEAVQAKAPPVDLTAKSEPELWAKRLGGELLPWGTVRLAHGVQISALEGFEDGAWWVQDAAASLPVRALAPRAGERILDLCAAPGGKTLQLAAAGAEVTALDISEARTARLRENLRRTGLVAQVVVGDALKHQGRYDAILLDAPCSSTGTLRRHPDLSHIRDGGGIDTLLKLQWDMLCHALTLLRPGGRCVFATCSLLPDEGEAHMARLKEMHPSFRLNQEALALPGVPTAWLSPEGGLRLRPDHLADRGGMDVFYLSVIARPQERVSTG